MIDKANNKLSIRKQCSLLGINRSRIYYKAASIGERDLSMMNFIDTEFTAHPFTGVERMAEVIWREKGLTKVKYLFFRPFLGENRLSGQKNSVPSTTSIAYPE